MQAIKTEVATCTLSATVKQSDIKAALARVSKGVASRSTLPILNNILLETTQDTLRISATNLEIAITVEIPATNVEWGSTTIPAKVFGEYISSLGSGIVELRPIPSGAEGVQVRSGSAQAHMRGMRADEFPRIHTLDDAVKLLTLDCVTLKGIINEVAFCAAKATGRPVFTAVLMNMRDEDIVFAAADTFRLGVRSVPYPTTDEEHQLGKWLIPASTLETLASILPDTGEAEIYDSTNNQVFFQVPGLVMTSRVIEGTFPNYDAIVPHEHTTRIVAPREMLIRAVRSASVFEAGLDGHGKGNTIRLQFVPGESELMPGSVGVSATSDELGDSDARVDCTIDGPAVHILLNCRFMEDVLNVIGTPEVVLQLTTPQSPLLMRGMGHDTYTHVIMPLYSRG